MKTSEFLRLTKAGLAVSRTKEQARLEAELGNPNEHLGLVRYDSRGKTYRAKPGRKALWLNYESSWELLMTASPEQAAFYEKIRKLSETSSLVYVVGVAALFAVAAPFVSIDGLIPSSFLSNELHLLTPGIGVFVLSLSAKNALVTQMLGPLRKA